jgi:hypothetical protein
MDETPIPQEDGLLNKYLNINLNMDFECGCIESAKMQFASANVPTQMCQRNLRVEI